LQYIVIDDIYVLTFNGGRNMMLHIIIVVLECAALAAFLILWQMILRKKLRGSFLREAGQQVLLPFRYFSWVLMALVLVTCLVQIHFVWLSSQIQEEMTSVNRSMQDQQIVASGVDELKGLIDKLLTHTEANVKELRALGSTHQRGQLVASAGPVASGFAQVRSQDKETAPASESFHKDPEKGAFGKEARASSARNLKNLSAGRLRKGGDSQDRELFSMQVSRVGNITRSGLRVRKQPSLVSDVVEKLAAGQQVKVTEKRAVKDTVWFRVITQSGTAGWVDYRYLRLEAKADSSSM
jgi:hypothetical protein